jgi:competence transcription factor ComK
MESDVCLGKGRVGLYGRGTDDSSADRIGSDSIRTRICAKVMMRFSGKSASGRKANRKRVMSCRDKRPL